MRCNWWSSRRTKYNNGLILSFFISFVLNTVTIEFVIPREEDVDVTLISIFFQFILFVIAMLFANLLYGLGSLSEIIIEPKNVIKYRKRIYNLGFWFSCGLPISMPVISFIYYISIQMIHLT